MTRSIRAAVSLGAFAILAGACSSSGDTGGAVRASSSNASSAAAATTTTAAAMALPGYAKDLKISLPKATAAPVMVTANEVTVDVAATGFTPDCNLAGKPDAPGTGHYHVLLDKSLVNMYCTPTATVSMQNVKPGMHTLEVVPALNDHSEVEENAVSMPFDYEPTSPLPTIADATGTAAPSIKITSPKPGEVVKGRFDIVVEITGFQASCDLYGKPGVAGYGHWHVNLDSTSGPPMGMGTMLGMSCTKVLRATTDGLRTGDIHDVIALLVDNGHAPLKPAVEDKVQVRIG